MRPPGSVPAVNRRLGLGSPLAVMVYVPGWPRLKATAAELVKLGAEPGVEGVGGGGMTQDNVTEPSPLDGARVSVPSAGTSDDPPAPALDPVPPPPPYSPAPPPPPPKEMQHGCWFPEWPP